jgi:AraC-like DNA-binding protein
MAVPPTNKPHAIGSGRILLWRGGSLWIGQAQDATDLHAHHAIQITLALSKEDLHFRSDDQPWQPYRAALIPADRPHAFDASGATVALLFVEPESRQGKAIRARFGDAITALPDQLYRSASAALKTAYENAIADEALSQSARHIIDELAASNQHTIAPLDKRIERAIESLHAQLDHNITLSDIAESVHLSPERFRHLFVEQTGVRFRPYILWLRLGVALSAYASGATLTDAAYAGGFADSAHFSRTFKRMFGTAPIRITPE